MTPPRRRRSSPTTGVPGQAGRLVFAPTRVTTGSQKRLLYLLEISASPIFTETGGASSPMDKTGWRLLKEEEWCRFYASSAYPRIYESKFATGEARISLSDLQSRWQDWNEGDRVQFARAYGSKRALSAEDEQILGFLMQQSGEMISTSIAILVAKLFDKKRAARFLVNCLRAFRATRANFLAALADLAAPETALDLSLVFQECSHNVAENAQDYDSAVDLLYCSDALFRITAEAKYPDVIASYLHHPSNRVRGVAEMIMRRPAPRR